MTRIFIDDREIEPPDDSSSVCKILTYVDKEHLAENSGVTRIQVNGNPMVPVDSWDTGENAISGRVEMPDRVEIFTASIANIARGSISEALAYLDRVETLTPSLAESFRVNTSPDSLGNLRQLYEGFYWLHLLLDKLRADFPTHPEDVLIRNGFEPEYHRKFVCTLKRLKEAQERADLAQVSDLLEAEILPFVPLWREMLLAVARRVDGAR